MTDTSSSFYSRGTSVLAALVVAAVLGSVGLLVQETSPIALTQAGQAAAGGVSIPASQPSAQTKTKNRCDPGYDYQVDYLGKTLPQSVCPGQTLSAGKNYLEKPSLSDWGQNNGRCVKTKEYPNGAAGQNWKCIVKLCRQDPKSENKELICDQVFYSDDENSPVVSSGKSTATAPDAKELAESAARGDTEALKDGENPMQADPEMRKAIVDAYREKDRELENKILQSDDTIGRLSSFTAACAAGQQLDECSELQMAKDVKEEAVQQRQNLADQYRALGAAAWKLDAEGLGSASLEVCAENPDDCDLSGYVLGGKEADESALSAFCSQNPTYPACVGNRQGDTFGPGAGGPGNSAACQACDQNHNNYNACMQCSGKSGGGPGQGGQKPGGGAGGGGGHQQQQCQPRYVCNGNSVMYVPCTNNGQGSAQMVQQCPTGYSCSAAVGSSNSSCQIQAQYGYCADGRTPRTGPAQQQPPASTCTSGTWQDTSNGCQTSWQCVSGTGQPTAQLSCQPTSATAGMSISLSYACANGATTASTTGFTVPAGSLSGTASAVVQKPAIGNTVTYGLSCMSAAATSSAQCQVRVAGTSIVLIATPEKIQKSETEELKRKSTIGWVTTGMQSCVISSTDLPTWSDSQASITSVAGAVTTPAIDADTTFKLTCQTFGGTEASSTVKVLAI